MPSKEARDFVGFNYRPAAGSARYVRSTPPDAENVRFCTMRVYGKTTMRRCDYSPNMTHVFKMNSTPNAALRKDHLNTYRRYAH